MAFRNDSMLAGYEIVDYDPGDELQSTDAAYRIATDFDGSNGTFAELFEQFLADPRVSEVKALSVGFWGSEYADVEYCGDLPQLLINAASGPLSQLEALFVGDISYEENEVSWIEQFELGGVVNAFKKLKHFKARGGMGLSLSEMDNASLETLILETGGMDGGVVRQIIEAKLPALSHLELWTGNKGYGATVTLEDVKPLLVGTAYPAMRYPFPALKYLGIRNSELADEVAEMLHDAKVLDFVKTIDLSKGLLSDRGVKALAGNEGLSKLSTLDVSNNYIGDADLLDRVAALGVKVINSGQKSSEEDYWYVEVGE
jgi:hypothetical protein